MTPLDLLGDVDGIVFDVGETLVDETRMWTAWAHEVGVSPLTVMGVLGGVIERGEDHRRVWEILGTDRPRGAVTLEPRDLYPDAVECLRAAREASLRVGIAGNQPAGVVEELRGLGFDADFICSSAAWGVAKPSPGFFDRVLDTAGLVAGRVLYVGDRLDNDVLPARERGMRTAFLRRGPWGHLHARHAAVDLADLRLASLSDLTAMLRAGRGREDVTPPRM